MGKQLSKKRTWLVPLHEKHAEQKTNVETVSVLRHICCSVTAGAIPCASRHPSPSKLHAWPLHNCPGAHAWAPGLMGNKRNLQENVGLSRPVPLKHGNHAENRQWWAATSNPMILSQTSVDVALQLTPHTSYSHQKNVPGKRVRETGGFVQHFRAEVAGSCRHQSKRNELSSSANQVVESERLVKYRRHPSLLMLLQGQMCLKMFFGGLAFAFPNYEPEHANNSCCHCWIHKPGEGPFRPVTNRHEHAHRASHTSTPCVRAAPRRTTLVTQHCVID